MAATEKPTAPDPQRIARLLAEEDVLRDPTERARREAAEQRFAARQRERGKARPVSPARPRSTPATRRTTAASAAPTRKPSRVVVPEQPTTDSPAVDPNEVIGFRSVSHNYAGRELALDGVSASIRRGEFVFLVGATGSGKSTLMRLLMKELEPTGGSVNVAGRDLSEITRRRVPAYRRNIGMVFQDFKLLPNRTVYENVAFALQVTGASRKEIRAAVPDVLRLTGLSTKLHNHPHELSGGEQQRVALARAMVLQPALLLADEPTGNLDRATGEAIHSLFLDLNRERGSTMLVVTHNPELASMMPRRLRMIDGGQLVDETTPLVGRPSQPHAVVGQDEAAS